jgi:hypothetical protein
VHHAAAGRHPGDDPDEVCRLKKNEKGMGREEGTEETPLKRRQKSGVREGIRSRHDDVM